MANKDEEFKPTDLASGFANLKSDDTSWIIGLALISALFSDNGFGYKGLDKNTEIETRLAKLETKTDLLEKIILK